jgi:hypothetical protein
MNEAKFASFKQGVSIMNVKSPEEEYYIEVINHFWFCIIDSINKVRTI